jgi:hypothetical protein
MGAILWCGGPGRMQVGRLHHKDRWQAWAQVHGHTR